MRVLLSVYACKPGVGSEPGVGWRWAVHLAQRHQVTVLTHRRFERDIEEGLRGLPAPHPVFHYHDTPVLRRVPFNSVTAIPKYVVWQISVMPLARRLASTQRFDVAMHLTMGTFRYPSWLGFLGVPFVLGPVGGGERAPLRFFAGLPWRERLAELVRTTLIVSGRFDPLLWLAHRRARLIFARTRETMQALPPGLAQRVVIRQEIGSDPSRCSAPGAVRGPVEPLRLVMAARLLGWKGVHIAVDVMAHLKRRGVLATLEVFGEGRIRQWLEARIDALDVADVVTLRGYVPFQDMQKAMRDAHLFLFPSLHDSGGTVVLEAFGNGLPVLCLDLGGPHDFVTPACGRVVSTAGRGIAQVAEALAVEVEGLANDEVERGRLVVGALARAEELSWTRQMDGAIVLIEAAVASQVAAKSPNCADF